MPATIIAITVSAVPHGSGGRLTITKIIGNNDGPGGRNETYRIGQRRHVPRPQAVREVEQGKHPGAHIVTINGQKYVRDNPDHSTRDNVHRNK